MNETNQPSQGRLEPRLVPDTHEAAAHKFSISGHNGYIIVGLFPDGTPCELFIIMANEGSTIGGLLDSIASLTTILLRYGIPLDVIVRSQIGKRFEPSGQTPDMGHVTSVTDYVFRWLHDQFVAQRAEHHPDPSRVAVSEGGKMPG